MQHNESPWRAEVIWHLVFITIFLYLRHYLSIYLPRSHSIYTGGPLDSFDKWQKQAKKKVLAKVWCFVHWEKVVTLSVDLYYGSTLNSKPNSCFCSALEDFMKNVKNSVAQCSYTYYLKLFVPSVWPNIIIIVGTTHSLANREERSGGSFSQQGPYYHLLFFKNFHHIFIYI